MSWRAEHLLKAIAETEADCLTTAAMARASALTRRRVVQCCDVLRRRGFIERVRRGCYRVTDLGRAVVERDERIRSGPVRAHTGKREVSRTTLRAKIWTALRILKKGTVNDFLELAQSGTERNAVNNAYKYLRALELAGYVQQMKVREAGTAPSSNGFKRYLLVNDSGALPPVYYAAKRTVRDPNDGKEISLAEAS